MKSVRYVTFLPVLQEAPMGAYTSYTLEAANKFGFYDDIFPNRTLAL